MQDSGGPVHIHTAEDHCPARNTAKDVHELLGLTTGSEHHVHHNFWREASESVRAAGKVVSIPNDFFRVTDWSLAPVKDAHVMTERPKLQRHVAADKARGADQQNPHLRTSGLFNPQSPM
jgi:hypothetical protein